MSQVQNNSSVSELLASNGGSIKTARKGDEDMQERFLKLLVTQMQNQDPLSPMDNAEVTSQMAQISTVSGIDKLNSTLEKLVSDSDARRSFEAANMIGRSVLIPGADMQLENHTGIGGFELTEPADKLVVTIKDSAGIAVRDIDLGAQPAGVGTFAWDGLANNGNEAAGGQYSFALKAVRSNQEVAASTLAFGSVSSAQAGKDGALLEVGRLGYVGMDDIKKIF
ncbi:flagellar basal-body rod modification protein FlgD [Nitrosomonas eutropha]|uniref:Basal-body rod modification protein FlgD n=1 Tax=Nitrosomonas eutropha TaxID=916 RepID=A0A1I7H3C6_9PROT|nr:flagellar hook assembly protein FlgD [Nitrosomonas eutropha]SFU55204.1 flagellar basal-body rod modification protein FlgD [Nitrosomonas eutropha]